MIFWDINNMKLGKKELKKMIEEEIRHMYQSAYRPGMPGNTVSHKEREVITSDNGDAFDLFINDFEALWGELEKKYSGVIQSQNLQEPLFHEVLRVVKAKLGLA
jgi:hypothetical protein